MTTRRPADQEQRVLVLLPVGRDAQLTGDILGRAGIQCLSCRDSVHLLAELQHGAAALLLAEEAVATEQLDGLGAWLAAQPAWSDLPLLVLARPGADSATVGRAISLLGNVTVLERPTRVATLVSAVLTALRARGRQYQIREQFGSLQRAEAEVRLSDRRKDEFLAILAHELRNPLAPIRNSLYVLRATGTSDPLLQQVTETMDRQVGHMVRLVDDLLEISRISRGKVELRRVHTDLAAALAPALEASRPLIEQAGHALHTELPSGPIRLDADPVRLAQVFTNLLNNAAKYTEPPGLIRLEVRKLEERVEVSVSDNGLGIPAEMLPRIFDLFTQVDTASDRARGGLGIGLTLVKSLVEMHGGTVTAVSEGVGQGSCFTVSLPLAIDAPSGTPTEVPEDVPLPGPGACAALGVQRVVVVDDNRDAADSLGQLLRLLGAEVRVAYDGPEALAVLAECRPTIVLLDLGMPGMDGYEVARRLRQQPHGRELTLIALSGWGQEQDQRRTREAGFDHHFVKPADLPRLQSLLVSLSEGARPGVPLA
jgi:signal transduction histidine kinase/ActR/RegA family two-component response regulator